ncbi:DNA mismatch repair protein MutS domain-containing protein [Salinarchaeum sp. Harcht-Bsk1]|uniref:MutS-related protein n=1 Tax=Salinarchaeum sp. Harcht-Bsk1 TaxID=1333523 RepID=UPI00034230B8|nr:DNA mismatch repair protein MutS [Salinarchaeum sp. Harcht-Bsk1]AGN01273.1 DNA mismatch repair protein MutS domain-containing protein [Salinarchaeum sp. Harcht-Bsk1]
MDLEAIPGVGAKTAESLETLDDPERALREGDVARIAEAPDVTPGRAARIARGAIRAEHDDPGGFLGTSRAREIHSELLGLLQERTVTDYAAHRLETFYPSPAASRIAEARSIATAAMERDPEEAVLEALEGVEPLSAPSDVRVRDRCLATTDAERYAEAQEAIPEVAIEVVDDARGLAELARGYATVVALDESFAGVDVDGDVRVEPDALDRPQDVVPERTLAFFAANREALAAAIDVHRAAALDAPLDLDELEDALDRLGEDGEPVGDEELQRLQTALDDLDATVSTAESVATDHLRDSLRERDVTVEGADLLSLVEQGAGVDSILDRELADEHAEAVEAAREHLVDALELGPAEAERAHRIIPDDPTFPVERNEDAMSRLRESLRADAERRAAKRKRELADDLAGMREDARALVRAALELDVELAIARFARDFECTMPRFADPELAAAADSAGEPAAAPDGIGVDPEADAATAERTGPGWIAIEGGRSPLLDEPPDAIEPVDYAVGGVALLSGVNSGGKTSTLDLVAATVVLAQMGLPVPADEVALTRFDALHYHAKTQGTLDAGAFEATVREFGDLAAGGEGALVLVDELESITEPGASAKIVAGVLEALDDQGATGIFVSHLAGEIAETASFDVAVDGIQAEGLEDGELVVDRSPRKDHLARSTPELIVEKLAEEQGEDFYEDLLAKF